MSGSVHNTHSTNKGRSQLTLGDVVRRRYVLVEYEFGVLRRPDILHLDLLQPRDQRALPQPLPAEKHKSS